ncbi:MAG: DUF779 domain-containing protein [Acetobacteraceae bacterium]|nr:DUF779 domain-containing protein [Acetobacteraceae bacterium]
MVATPRAAALIRALRDQHGPLLFHLSGGCCEGSAPMCLRQRDFRIGGRDVQLGEVEGCPVYAGAGQAVCWTDYHVTLDVVDGGGDSFSLEAADGVRFIARSALAAPG